MAFSIRYMGSKRSLAGKICKQISKDNPSAPVLDVFSGMCAVGAELAARHPIHTNDAHNFAAVIAHALFVEETLPPTSLHAREELTAAFTENAKRLRSHVGLRLHSETEALARIADGAGWKRLLALNEAETAGDWPRKRAGEDTYSLVTDYFSFGYFGLKQSIEIDSIRYAIEKAPEGRKSYYLSCLLRAASECSAAPGHFAQFLIPRDKKTAEYIARIRQRSILDRFYRALDEFERAPCIDRVGNRSHCSDAIELLENFDSIGLTCKVIYADPPYSKAQYSRYYHVLETIVLYDYPDCTGKGRYRAGRFMTGFSQSAKVTGEMQRLVNSAAQTNCELYLSYPTNGLLYSAGSSVEAVMRRSYPKVEKVASVPLRHSTMGGAPGAASIMVTEDVYRGYF